MPEGIEDRRMQIYRDLFINSITGLLAGSFPVIHSLYEADEWQDLVRGFFKTEHNHTPHFPEIPREFVQYLQQNDADPNKPFLAELAHYEWLELHLEKHQTECPKSETVNLLTQRPVVSPLARMHEYAYPVHQIKTAFQPTVPDAQPHHLLVWRNAAYQVKFTALNPMSAWLLAHLHNNEDLTGQALLAALAQEAQAPDPAAFIDHAHQTMQGWYEQDIIIQSL